VVTTATRSVPSKPGAEGLTKEQLRVALEAFSSYVESKPVIHAYFVRLSSRPPPLPPRGPITRRAHG
jgi:hypothetical protein